MYENRLFSGWGILDWGMSSNCGGRGVCLGVRIGVFALIGGPPCILKLTFWILAVLSRPVSPEYTHVKDCYPAPRKRAA